MSVYGWRWWDISRSGALMSVNGVIWEPNEPVKAECLNALSLGGGVYEYGFRHQHVLVLPDGRRTIVPRTTKLGKRKHGAEVIPEAPPAYECHCGMWAYYDPDGAFALPRSHGNTYLRTTKVFGIVEAWGDIVWMDLGFRAEYAQVRAVVVTRGKLHKTYDTIDRCKNLDEIVQKWDVAPLEHVEDWDVGELTGE